MISEKIKRVIRNRGISYEEAGRRLKMTKQGVSWILNHRKDSGWTAEECEIWESSLNLPKAVFEVGE